ncbi:protein phosphatase 1 regulatory subunit 14C-like [Corticium candelabrum]|uniref:protein phosphatase 1 regulatory subunit 14C-like n=1 Tax=Corticium candelabrum TaxID=121492 RepID=UPI002E273228|nr:protein phosphatase 1 regulatory subunit 14C-like [Corticium candelabrum]
MTTTSNGKVCFDHAPPATRTKRPELTKRYNRKAVKLLLELEDWMEDQLRLIYACEPGDETPVDLFLDDILDNDEDKYEEYIKSKFETIQQPAQAFIDELLAKIKELNVDRKSRDSFG